ncbi:MULTISPECIES: hypothetical protein [Alphaproteobacteria]|nr:MULTISPECIES: hypothetical protein [Alphaproteobacteria]
MSFFRRIEEQAKGVAGSRAAAGLGSSAASAAFSTAATQSGGELGECHAFGSVVEESQLSSEQLLSGFGFLQERVSSLLSAHNDALAELAALRAERARIASLLDYESNARKKLDGESLRLAAECKELKTDNVQLRAETEESREKLVKLQALYEANAQDLSVVESRLRDATRELDERIGQYDETAALLKRAHVDLEQRNRDFSMMREKYETERTQHQVLAETSRRENDAQLREIARLTEEKGRLKNSLAHQDDLSRNLAGEVTSLKQELSFTEEKLKRLQSDLDNKQGAMAVEMSQLATRHEAINSKAELVEKLLVTARGRLKMVEDELQATRSELKQTKAELATAVVRADRLAQELSAARAGQAENESVRRDLSLQVSELTMRLRDSENTRGKRDRDAETMKRDLDQRNRADQEEIRQYRSSAEVARAEMRQLRSEIAILTGQLEVARNDRQAAPAAAMPAASLGPLEDWSLPVETGAKPIIDISEKSLRSAWPPAEA